MTSSGDRRLRHLWVIGPGRVGLAMGLLLRRAGTLDELTYTGRSAAPPDHPLFHGIRPASYLPDLSLPDPPPSAVLIAVPDEAIGRCAADLASLPLPSATPVLHVSGCLGADALAPLAEAGHPTGSLHPLVAVADPESGAEMLRGAWFGVEAVGTAREVAQLVVEAAEGRALAVDAGAKPLYHAAAVFASNYAVVLLAVAERLMASAGVDPGEARNAMADLATGAVGNVRTRGPAGALTGPAARGDADTLRAHLERLSAEDRALYSALAGRAVALAREAGLDGRAADGLERVLRGSG